VVCRRRAGKGRTSAFGWMERTWPLFGGFGHGVDTAARVLAMVTMNRVSGHVVLPVRGRRRAGLRFHTE
jgi:hypothetical protein